jgi:hypothetical protein
MRLWAAAPRCQLFNFCRTSCVYLGFVELDVSTDLFMYIYVTRCTNSLYGFDECCISRLCFVSDGVLFYKLNADSVFYPVVMGELPSASLSLLWT